MKKDSLIIWILSLIVAGILLSTVPFKLGGAEESVALFSELGVEPFGRIGLGIGELVAAILILVPATRAIGAVVVVGMMVGALGAHATVLGFEGDRGSLAAMAVVALVCSAAVAWAKRAKLPVVGKLLK